MIKNNEKKWLISALFLLIGILAILVIYAYIAKPVVNKYAVKAYNQGVNDALHTLFIQIQRQGFAKISLGNQTLILVPYKSKNKK